MILNNLVSFYVKHHADFLCFSLFVMVSYSYNSIFLYMPFYKIYIYTPYLRIYKYLESRTFICTLYL